MPLNYWTGEAIDMPYGSYAYLIKLKAATDLLRSAFPIRKPFDRYLGSSLTSGIRISLLSPPCISQNTSFSSTINYDPKIVYSTSFGKVMGVFIRKIYFWFPVIRTFRIWSYLKWNTLTRQLRKTGVLKNHVSNI